MFRNLVALVITSGETTGATKNYRCPINWNIGHIITIETWGLGLDLPPTLPIIPPPTWFPIHSTSILTPVETLLGWRLSWPKFSVS